MGKDFGKDSIRGRPWLGQWRSAIGAAWNLWGSLLRTFRQDGKSKRMTIQLKPKSVIRHAVSVFDWENEAFGHLARFCPHPVSRYAST